VEISISLYQATGQNNPIYLTLRMTEPIKNMIWRSLYVKVSK